MSISTKTTFKVNNVTSLKELRTTDAVCSISSRGLANIIDKGSRSMGHAPFVEETMATHGVLDAALLAFNYHKPLLLKPSHFWLMVVQGVAVHVKANAEKLRGQWVKHEGLKTLTVIDRGGNDLLDWTRTILKFVEQIRANTVKGVVELLSPPFSTITFNEVMACELSTMDIVQRYFNFHRVTRCGYPSITLDGTPEDWDLLHAHSLRLVKEKCLPAWASQWCSALDSVLSRIAAASRRGAPVDVDFWQSMCKRGGMQGSGGWSWVNGWINVFLPFTGTGDPNPCCVPYRPGIGYVKEGCMEKQYKGLGGGPKDRLPSDEVYGINQKNIPTGLSSCPVVWNDRGKKVDLEFRAGFLGVTQDPETGTLSPEVGWVLLNPLIKSSDIPAVESEIAKRVRERAASAKALAQSPRADKKRSRSPE